MKDNIQKDSVVEKALSPEEISMLSNIQSMVGELLNQSGFAGQQGGQGQAPAQKAPMPPAAQKAAVPTTDEMETSIEDKDKKNTSAKKELMTTPSDSATASDDAETRMDETETETTEEGVDEVAKSILTALKSLVTPKPAPAKVNPFVQALAGMANVQKSVTEEINELKTAVSGLLEGLGIVEQMKVQKSQIVKAEPITSAMRSEDVAAFVDTLAKAIGAKTTVEKAEVNSTMSLSQNDVIRKNLGNATILKGLIANKM